MFDPKPYLIQLPRRVKDKATGQSTTVYDSYLEVKWRLVWFRERYPHGIITTKEVCVDLERGYARYRPSWKMARAAALPATGRRPPKASPTTSIGRRLGPWPAPWPPWALAPSLLARTSPKGTMWPTHQLPTCPVRRGRSTVTLALVTSRTGA